MTTAFNDKLMDKTSSEFMKLSAKVIDTLHNVIEKKRISGYTGDQILILIYLTVDYTFYIIHHRVFQRFLVY